MKENMDGIDIAIIGGGIIGSMVAHYARAADSKAKLILFDRYTVSSGSTYLSGGLMPLIGPSSTALALAHRSRGLYQKLLAENPDFPIEERPAYWLFPKSRKVDLETSLGKSLDAQSQPSVELLDYYPDLSLPENYLIAQDDTVWWASAADVTCRLVDDVVSSGNGKVTLTEGVSIREIDRHNGLFLLHRSDGQVTRARRVIISTGPWVIFEPTQAWARNQQIRLKRTVCLHLQGKPRDDAPVLLFYDERAFMLPLPKKGRTLLNYTADEWDVDPILGEMQITEKDRVTALNILSKFLPSHVSDYTGGQVFCDAYTPQHIPYVNELNSTPGCVVIGGCSGSGVRFAPGLAKQALEISSINTQ